MHAKDDNTTIYISYIRYIRYVLLHAGKPSATMIIVASTSPTPHTHSPSFFVLLPIFDSLLTAMIKMLHESPIITVVSSFFFLPA